MTRDKPTLHEAMVECLSRIDKNMSKMFGMIDGRCSKELLVNRLNDVEINYTAQLAAAYLFKQKEVPQILERGRIVFESSESISRRSDEELSNDLYLTSDHNEKVYYLRAFSEPLQDIEFADICVRILLDSAARTVILDCYEILDDFQNLNGRDKRDLEEYEWYRFLYYVRNALTHKYIWGFSRNRRMRERLPLIWENRVIDISMEGQPLTTSTLNFQTPFILLAEIKQWANALESA